MEIIKVLLLAIKLNGIKSTPRGVYINASKDQIIIADGLTAIVVISDDIKQTEP